MSVIQTITESKCDRIIEESIDEQRHIAITHRLPQGWRLHKGEFVSGSKKAGTITMIAFKPRDGTEFTLPEPGVTVGISFRLGHRKCLFSATLESVETRDDGGLVTLSWPTSIQQLQRRSYRRVAPPRDQVIAVRFWQEQRPEAPGEDQRIVRNGQIEDISAGGMRVKAADPKNIIIGNTYRCLFTPQHGAPPVIVEATLRHREADDNGRASLGFQFLGLETTAEGRRLLERIARIVSQLQNRRRNRHY